MKKIPKIFFKSTAGATDIEFLPLTELFARIDKSPTHNPRLPHRISFFALLIVTDGAGVHQVDLQNYPIKSGDVLKIAKGQVHAFQEDFLYQGYLVVFTEEFILKYFSGSSIDFVSRFYNYHISAPLIHAESYIRDFLPQIRAELEIQNSYAQKEIIAKMMELFLLRLERLSNQQHAPDVSFNHKHQSIFFAFKEMLESEDRNSRNVKDYADRLNISAKHLNSIIREITLNTAKYFIDQYIILEIKRYIVCSTLSLKEIAFKCGFDEVTNFTKFFKKNMGVTPKEYKTLL
ncbi:helix-turn-helix domain-containing protein [Dyadobacter tibetensis]|uniref:helix-turn-helix domain-containing protein n=1 Tax=Dyadobacter tibetensis TaxID=1211851 RepID=UPI00046EE209|nr:helix-turn-helix domain-containing protein [Dyadobacter tibetensis]